MDRDSRYLSLARDIVLRHIDRRRVAVFLFGSRAKGSAGHASDIDVGIWGDAPVDGRVLARIRDDVEESTIPYAVDLVDLSLVTEEFRRVALEGSVRWNQPSA